MPPADPLNRRPSRIGSGPPAMSRRGSAALGRRTSFAGARPGTAGESEASFGAPDERWAAAAAAADDSRASSPSSLRLRRPPDRLSWDRRSPVHLCLKPHPQAPWRHLHNPQDRVFEPPVDYFGAPPPPPPPAQAGRAASPGADTARDLEARTPSTARPDSPGRAGGLGEVPSLAAPSAAVNAARPAERDSSGPPLPPQEAARALDLIRRYKTRDLSASKVRRFLVGLVAANTGCQVRVLFAPLCEGTDRIPAAMTPFETFVSNYYRPRPARVSRRNTIVIKAPEAPEPPASPQRRRTMTPTLKKAQRAKKPTPGPEPARPPTLRDLTAAAGAAEAPAAGPPRPADAAVGRLGSSVSHLSRATRISRCASAPASAWKLAELPAATPRRGSDGAIGFRTCRRVVSDVQTATMFRSSILRSVSSVKVAAPDGRTSGPQDSAGVETADVPAGLEPTASNERAAEAAPGAARRASEADEPAESDLRQAVLPLAPGAMRAKSQSRTPERPTELAPLHPDRGGQAPSRPATGFGLGADPGKPPSAPGRALTMTTTATTTPTGSRPTSHASAGRALSALASRIKPSSETESSLCLSPARRRRLGKARAAHPKSAPAVEQDLPKRVKEKAEIQQIIQRLERYGLLVRKPLPPVADAAGSTGTSASAGAGGSFDGLSRRPQAPGSITPLRASKTAEPRRTPRYQESAEAARGVARRPKTIDCRAVERAIFTPQEMYHPLKRWRSDDDGATKHLPLWKMVRADRLRIAALAAAAVAKNSSAARSAKGSGAGSHPPQTINLRLFLIKSSERRINQMRGEVDEWSQLTNRILQKPPRLAGHRFRQTSSAETGAGPAVTTGYAGRALNAGLPEPGVEKPTTGQQAGARFASEPPGRSGPRRRSALPAGTQLPKRPSTHGGAGVASATEPTESGGSPSANGASASPAPPSSSQGQPPDADGPGTRRSGREGGPRTRRGRRRSTSREPGERKAGVRILKETINSRNGRTDSFWHWNEYAGVREGWLGKKAKLVSISEGRRTRTAPGGRREGDHPGRPATSAGARRRDAAAAAASSEEDLRIAEPVQRTVSFAKITRDLVSARRERKEGNWFPSRPAARGGGGGGGGRADGGREPWKAAAKRLPAWRTAALQRRNSASALAPGPEAPPRGESARGSVFPRVPVLDALAARALLARRLGEGEKPPSPPRGGTYVQEYFARYRPAVL